MILYHIIYNLIFKPTSDTTAKFEISMFRERRKTILKSECLDCGCICTNCLRTVVLILPGLKNIYFISFLRYYFIQAKKNFFAEAHSDLLI